MKYEDIFKMCVQNLLRRKSRTLLTLLGVLIGCCSIVIMVSIGIGMTQSQKKMLEEMGDLTVITVNPKQGGGKKLDDKVLGSIRSMEGVVGATPKITLEDYNCTVKLYAGANDRYVAEWASVAGIDTRELENMGYKLLAGDVPGRSGQVLSGQYAAYGYSDSLRPGGSNMVDRWSGGFDKNGNPLDPPAPFFDAASTPIVMELETNGKKLRFPLQPCGLLKEDYAKGSETSEGILMDISQLREYIEQLQGSGRTQQGCRTVLVKVSDITKVSQVEKQIRELGFSTSSMESIRKPMEKEARQKQMMLGGLGAISLFVAALGITNTMIMSISERTREIGIMKSLGCCVKDIRILFLSEAGVIGLLGGLVGCIVSLLIAMIVNLVSFGAPPGPACIAAALVGGDGFSRICIVPFWLLLSAVVFSVAIGLGSGYYPANKAVQIPALEAIKS